jgi:hypothetical protein
MSMVALLLAAAFTLSAALPASANVLTLPAKNCSTLTVGVSSTGSYGGYHTVYNGPSYSSHSFAAGIFITTVNTVFNGWHVESSAYANRSPVNSAFVYCT